MRRMFAPVGLIVAALLTLGCEAAVTTDISVTSQQDAELQVSVTFTGDAAEAIVDSSSMQAQLVDVFEDRTGSSPSRTYRDGTLTYTSALSHDQLRDTSELTGVSDVRLDPAGGDQASVVLELTVPDKLLTAIADGVADESDADALVAAMTGSTLVVAQVTFPGGIEDVEVSEQMIVTGDDHTAVIEQPLSEFQEGTMVVTGSVEPGVPTWALTLAVGAVAALAVFILIPARRRARA